MDGMNEITLYLKRAREIIGERTPAEIIYDNTVVTCLAKGMDIRRAIDAANIVGVCGITSGLFRRPDGRQKNGGKKIRALYVFAPIFLPFPLPLATRSGRPSLSVKSVKSVVTFLWLRLAARQSALVRTRPGHVLQSAA